MKRPLKAKQFPPIDQNPNPWGGLVTSLPQEHSYTCEVEGEVPRELLGTLYRLGPGLYDRGEDRKRMVLDGDGMMQEFRFESGKVHYRNRFIRTNKFEREEEAKRFVYPTLSTHSSGSWLENLGITLPHQANITTLFWNERLFAFDESQKPYELSASTLDTMGEAELDQLQPKLRYWAHWKLDTKTRQVHMLAIDQGPKLKAHVVSLDYSGRVANRKSFSLPRASYFHDWFITENYFGFVLHPAIVSLKTLLRVGMGMDTFSDALKWQPEKANLIFLMDRHSDKQYTFEAPACWMWHSLNAYEVSNEVFVDFIGSEEGGGLGDSDSPLFTIMQNQETQLSQTTVNHLRRYRIQPKNSKLIYQTLAGGGNFELPTVASCQRGTQYDYGHFIFAKPGEFFARGLGEWNQRQEKLEAYHSSHHEYFSEPLSFSSLTQDSPYLSSLVYDGDKKRSYLGIFRVGELSQGPIAKVWLQHHAPLGFHGYWHAII